MPDDELKYRRETLIAANMGSADQAREIVRRIDAGKIVDPFVISYFKPNPYIHFNYAGEHQHGGKKESE